MLEIGVKNGMEYMVNKPAYFKVGGLVVKIWLLPSISSANFCSESAIKLSGLENFQSHVSQ